MRMHFLCLVDKKNWKDIKDFFFLLIFYSTHKTLYYQMNIRIDDKFYYGPVVIFLVKVLFSSLKFA